jgi:hypothetical protein
VAAGEREIEVGESRAQLAGREFTAQIDANTGISCGMPF